MIDRIKQTVETFLNTDNRGNFKPESYDTILHSVVLDRHEQLFFEVNRMANRQNRGLLNGGLENVTEKLREKIQHYIVDDVTLTYSTNRFILPEDLRYFDAVLYNEEIIEMLKSNKEFNTLKSTNPSEAYPLGLKVGNVIKVLPTTIVDNVTVSYIRNPLRAKWTYTIVGGVEQYNPDADDFVDVDAHISEEFDITIGVLRGFGINLKEQDVQAIAQNIENTVFNEENAS